VTELEAAIVLWANHWNDDPRPFIRKITAAEIIKRVHLGRAALAHRSHSAKDH